MVEEKIEKLEEELKQSQASCQVLENELWYQNSRVSNINVVNEQLKEFIAQAKQQQAHQKSFLDTLEMNKNDQKDIIENVEV